MAFPVIIRQHDFVKSYLVLDDNPRELLRHPGFQEEFSVRVWLGSLDPVDAREEWCEMLAEDLDYYSISDSDNREFQLDLVNWQHLVR
jgi:hypothetical protein